MKITAAFLLMVVMLSGCASFVNVQEGFRLKTDPPTARCSIDNWQADPKNGRTDGFVQTDTTRGHIVYCAAPGYDPAVILVESRVSAWVWGDVIMGGPIGFIIDFADGAAYRLKPDSVLVRLRQSDALRERTSGN